MYGGFYHPWFGIWGLGWPIMAAIAIIPFWRICMRVGLSPWLSLLLVVPIANVIFVYYVAFGEWPAVPRSGPGSGSAGSGLGFSPPPGPRPGPNPGPGPGSGPTTPHR